MGAADVVERVVMRFLSEAMRSLHLHTSESTLKIKGPLSGNSPPFEGKMGIF